MFCFRWSLVSALLIILCSFSTVYAREYGNIRDFGKIEKLISAGQFEEVLQLSQNSIAIDKKISPSEKIYYTYALGMSEFRLMKLDDSMKHTLECLNFISKSKDSLLISKVWKLAAYCYNYNGKLDSALIYSKMLYDYGKRNKDLKLTCDATASIATILAQKGEYQSALKLYKETEIRSLKLKDSVAVCIANYNIGLMYLHLHQNDSCINRVNKSLTDSRKFNRKDLMVMAYGTLADCYLLQNKLVDWKRNLNQAISISKDIKNYQYYAMGLLNLMSNEIKNNQYSEAVGYGKLAETVLQSHPYPILQIQLDSMMYYSYKASGQSGIALNYLESFNKRKNEFEDKKSKSILSEFMVKYDLVKKELIIAKQSFDISEQNKKLYFLIIGFVFLLTIVLIYTFWVFKLNKFRHQLFVKEKYLEKELNDNKEWTEWKLNKEADQEIKNQQAAEKKSSTSLELQNQKWLFMELRELFDTQKLYLNPDLDIDVVIKALGTNKKYLYFAITSNRENFRSFINKYRIEEAKRLIQNSIENRTLPNISEIYEKSGFNSNVTFYRAFKTITGLTPKEYTIEIQLDFQKNLSEK